MPDASNSWNWSERLLQIIILVAVLLVVAFLGVASWALMKSQDQANTVVVLPMLAIGGVLSLLVVLALVSVFFQMRGLANPGQALALPEGSVRAVIALGLIVLFAILAIYLYASTLTKSADDAYDLAKQLITIVGTLVTAVASFYFGANTVASAHKAAHKATAEAQKNGEQDDGKNGNAPGGGGDDNEQGAKDGQKNGDQDKK